MTKDEVEKMVERALATIAPEAHLDAIDRARPLRDQLNVDSIDATRFLAALHRATGIDIPMRDYRKLDTFDGCVAYVLYRAALTAP